MFTVMGCDGWLVSYCVCAQMGDLPSLVPTGNPTTLDYLTTQTPALQAILTLGSDPLAAAINVYEYQKGTRVSSGVNATSQAVGAVYTYKYNTGTHVFDEVRRMD